MVIDEIHLLGADRGPILEVIVSRMRCVRSRAPNWARGIQRLAPHALTQWLRGGAPPMGCRAAALFRAACLRCQSRAINGFA